MDLAWIEDFLCLARTLNFTRAAEERNITQPAFSRRIRSLEIWAGAPLIDRASYPAKLLPAGELFLPVAKEIVFQLVQAQDEMRQQERGEERFYSFAATHSISVNHLAEYVEALGRKLPEIRTRVVSDNLHACCQHLAEGACDFLFCYRYPKAPLLLDEALYARVDLGCERLLPVARANAAGAGWQLPGSPSDPIPYLGYASGSFLGTVVEHTIRGKGAALWVRHLDAFAEALKSLVLQGAGIAWLPEKSVSRAMSAGELIAVGGPDWTATMQLSAFAALDRLDQIGHQVWDTLRYSPAIAFR